MLDAAMSDLAEAQAAQAKAEAERDEWKRKTQKVTGYEHFKQLQVMLHPMFSEEQKSVEADLQKAVDYWHREFNRVALERTEVVEELEATQADLVECQRQRDEHKACRSRAVDDYTTLLDRFQKSMSDVHQLRKEAEYAAQSILRLTNERNRLESELAEWRSRGQA